MQDKTRELALVFAGGNAVGAYYAGAYEALHGQGLRPDWVVGASIGAVTAAIVAGNAPEDRVAKRCGRVSGGRDVDSAGAA